MGPFFGVFQGISYMCVVCALLSCGCSDQHQSSKTTPLTFSGKVVERPSLLANISTSTSEQKNTSDKGAHAHGAPAEIVFSELGGGVAYTVTKDEMTQVVHNGTAGKFYKEISWLSISPDGGRTAYVALTKDKYSVIVDGSEEKNKYEEVGILRFSPDGRHVLYDARSGKQWQIFLDGKKVASCPIGYSYYDKFFSNDATKIITIESPVEVSGPLRVITNDIAFHQINMKELPGAFINIIVNKEKTRFALINSIEGKKRLIEISLNQPGFVKEGVSFDDIIHPVFGPDGVSVAYIAVKGGKRYLILNGREEQLPDGILREAPAVSPDNKSAAIIIDDGKNGAYFYEAFAARDANPKYREAAGIVYNVHNGQPAYIAKKATGNIFMVVNGKEGPAFDMIVTPQFSPDGKYLVYRARKNGKRFVVLADAAGKMVRRLSSYEQVFQPVFTADGSSIAYGVKDGLQLVWKVEKLR